jgi:hypothetical protein
MVHVTSLRMSREDEVEDRQGNAIGCIRVFYTYFAVFVVLCRRAILVF